MEWGMAKELVLVSHGRFCEELKASTEMIMGPQESIHTVALLPEEGPEDFTAKFEAIVQGLEDYIVFADLLGGTPCNTVSRLILEGRAIDLYAGMGVWEHHLRLLSHLSTLDCRKEQQFLC